MHKTHNDLPTETRTRMADQLNATLATCLDLKTQIKQAHWNVKGTDFRALHLMFDEIAADVDAYADLIAERIVQLGGTAYGTARVAAKTSILPEYPHEITSGKQHLEAVTIALSNFAHITREGIAKSDEINDADTADIYTEVSRGTDKWLWMVEAHLA
jgi:starvation-inducible DNA-binding protein